MATVDDALNGAQHSPDGRRPEELAAENARLREELVRLRAVMGVLERDRAEVAAERDSFRKSLLALTWEDFTFTQEEIDDLDKNGLPFDEKFIEELERDLRALGPSDA